MMLFLMDSMKNRYLLISLRNKLAAVIILYLSYGEKKNS